MARIHAGWEISVSSRLIDRWMKLAKAKRNRLKAMIDTVAANGYERSQGFRLKENSPALITGYIADGNTEILLRIDVKSKKIECDCP